MNDLERQDFIEKNARINFFGGTIKPDPIIPEKIKPVKEGNVYTADEITMMLDTIDDFDYVYDSGVYHIIDEELSIESDKKNSVIGLFKNLIGYKVKVKQKGNHKNDGQMVDYKFTFKSHEGVKTVIWTDMCLMCGWNHCSEETIE